MQMLIWFGAFVQLGDLRPFPLELRKSERTQQQVGITSDGLVLRIVSHQSNRSLSFQVR
jgi:hypothetical protein